ncbi:MAG TPA: lytic transglycosylase domain-containing protein [Rectinemataceae bacterium]|nr:lytic transglycosylase domain-containing protein [Rectinemataceae bacterium]
MKRLFSMASLMIFLVSGMGVLGLSAQDGAPPQNDIVAPDSAAVEGAPVPIFDALPLTQEGMGAEAWYYEAKKLEQDGAADPEQQASIEAMYTLAFHFGEKVAAREAGKALLQRAVKATAPSSIRTIASFWLDYFGPDWEVFRTLIAACMESGDPACAIETIETLRAVSPSIAKTKIGELAFSEYSARAALGDFSWSMAALAYLKTASLDSWGSKILRLAASAPDLDVETKELVLMRADFREKEYTQAAAHASGAGRLLHEPGTARFLISEAGKAYVNAGAKEEGMAFFMSFFPDARTPDSPEAIVSSLAAKKPEERLWVAAYYLARLWLSADRSQNAAILFLALTDSAPSAADADGALWYWLDITMRRIAADDIATFDAGSAAAAGANGATAGGNAAADIGTGAVDTNSVAAASPEPGPSARRSLELGALLEASARWKDPAYFDDIVESYDRLLLKGKSWNDLLSLLILIGEKISPTMKTRLLYQAGRLIEEKLALNHTADSPEKDLAAGYFRQILDNPNAEEYYRTMSAWRLGIDPPYLKQMPDLSAKAFGDEAAGARPASPEAAYAAATAATGNGNAGINGNGVQSALTLIRNYLNYDLDEMAFSLAMNYLGSLDKAVIAGLAFDLSKEGQHYAALRLARDAVNRGAGSQYPELYRLIYPKAWNDIVAVGAAISGIPEALAYGIIRSESTFDPKAVSYAGAVGLSQLMPSTAAETASGLKMQNYSLTDPADNVRIGFTYYSYMLARFGGKPMRAMFAYNAGPSRMMAWSRESGELPDDILLETLHLAQPRQYAKNIIQATLAFGKIQYGIAALPLLDYLVDAKPLRNADRTEEAVAAKAAEGVLTVPPPLAPAQEAPAGHGETM